MSCWDSPDSWAGITPREGGWRGPWAPDFVLSFPWGQGGARFWLIVLSSHGRAVEVVTSPSLWWSWRKPFLPHSRNPVEKGLTVTVPVLPPSVRFNTCFLISIFFFFFKLKEAKPNKTKLKKKKKLTSGWDHSSVHYGLDANVHFQWVPWLVCQALLEFFELFGS